MPGIHKFGLSLEVDVLKRYRAGVAYFAKQCADEIKSHIHQLLNEVAEGASLDAHRMKPPVLSHIGEVLGSVIGDCSSLNELKLDVDKHRVSVMGRSSSAAELSVRYEFGRPVVCRVSRASQSGVTA